MLLPQFLFIFGHCRLHIAIILSRKRYCITLCKEMPQQLTLFHRQCVSLSVLQLHQPIFLGSQNTQSLTFYLLNPQKALHRKINNGSSNKSKIKMLIINHSHTGRRQIMRRNKLRHHYRLRRIYAMLTPCSVIIIKQWNDKYNVHQGQAKLIQPS